MSFQKLEGHNSLFSSTVVSQKQFDMTQKIIKANGGDPRVQGKALHTFANELFDMKYCPYFIGKNVALKVKNVPGLFDLSRLKVAKVKETKKSAPSVEVAVTKKKESKAKKGKSTPVVTIDETKLIEAPSEEVNIDAALAAL